MPKRSLVPLTNYVYTPSINTGAASPHHPISVLSVKTNHIVYDRRSYSYAMLRILWLQHYQDLVV